VTLVLAGRVIPIVCICVCRTLTSMYNRNIFFVFA